MFWLYLAEYFLKLMLYYFLELDDNGTAADVDGTGNKTGGTLPAGWACCVFLFAIKKATFHFGKLIS